MATHSSILAWEIPWIKETGGLQSKRAKKSWTQQLQGFLSRERLETIGGHIKHKIYHF